MENLEKYANVLRSIGSSIRNNKDQHFFSGKLGKFLINPRENLFVLKKRWAKNIYKQTTIHFYR